MSRAASKNSREPGSTTSAEGEPIARLHHWAASRWAPAAVGVVACAVFLGTLRFDFVFDDVKQILGNPWVWDARHLTDLLSRPVWSFVEQHPTNYYRPVQMLLYALDAQVFGRHPFGFHLTNVVMHALAVVAATLLLRRVTGAGRAVYAGLLFAVHPAHVESVAWVAGSTDVNCAVAMFLSLWAWSAWRRRAGAARWRWGALAGVLFLIALLAKETAVVTPLLALSLPAAPDSNGPGRTARPGTGWRTTLCTLLVFGLALGLYLAIRMAVLGDLRPLVARPQLPSWVILGSGLALVPRYLLVAFIPWQPTPERVVGLATGPLQVDALLGAAILIVAAVAFVRLRRTAPDLSWGIAMLILPLLPVLQVHLFAYDLQPDRYLYIPSLGACVLLAGAAAWLWRLGGTAAWRRGVAAVCLALVAAGTVRTATAAEMWRSNEALGRAGIALEPRSIDMHLLLISALDGAGRIDEALAAARTALRLAPSDARLLAAAAGLRARRAGVSDEESIAIYREALAANPRQPHLWASLAAVCVRAGRPEEAVRAARRALAIERYNTSAMLNLGTAMGQLGDPAGQEREARRLLDIAPHLAAGWLNLGAARLAQEDPDGAERALRRAVRIEPGLARAHFYLSWIATRRGQTDEAVRHARLAVQGDADDPDLWNRLGVALVQAGDRRGARAAWEKAIEFEPEHAQALQNLERLEE